MTQTIFIACDHAGLPLKQKLLENYSSIEWKDLGTTSEDSVDYPDYADQVAQEIQKDAEYRGILICGSGQGMAMRANKYPKVRAALCWSEEVTRLSRQHNDANVLVLGSRVLGHDLALKLVKIFLDTPFEGGRHQRRVDKISRPV